MFNGHFPPNRYFSSIGNENLETAFSRRFGGRTSNIDTINPYLHKYINKYLWFCVFMVYLIFKKIYGFKISLFYIRKNCF